ncbi:BCL2-associated athanogene-like proteins and related BAG family chaperone regulators protein [Dioscorea alata]|uniref:BCL2-associated athanogene-like proteins and related BAG family chaperone regulators protein n=1 Tax=Dioscorea alata TaxID=55571 RepID=A0ACB7U018_DIOAL|nr:BCL2-associated athanogene-like proteins and related BAG family chaperone regulators protein [Dioscorea alata]
MMRMQTRCSAFGQEEHGEAGDEARWEMRPGGMLVQKREGPSPPAPTIRVRVKHGGASHEIYLSSQATFGELKKLLAERTGMHPGDQKIVFKDKERASNAFLDISGVKDGSKMVLLEDPAAQAKRCLEMRRNAKLEKASKSISQISLDVDKLASQVSALEAIVAKDGKVAEHDVLNLIELLMNQLLKLDGIIADGDVKLQRRMQVRRVQKYVETLDVIKIKNSMPTQQPPQQQQQQQRKQKQSAPAPVVATTKWEVFDSMFSPSTSAANSSTTARSTNSSSAPTPRFDWELF